MNKLYQTIIQTFVITIISLVTTNVHAMAGGNDHGESLEAARNYNPGVVPPHAKIQGKTYGAWGAEWWKWALSVPFSQSPITDNTGEFGSQNQKGSVWFLAGTFGSTAERTITIPTGKFIFFPITNIENDYPCPDPAFQPASGQTLADFLTFGSTPFWGAVDYINPWLAPENTMSVKVDGVSLKNLLNYRGTSQLTKFTADPTEIAMDSCITGSEQVMVSDGFWIMLAPLKPGKHEIEFSATGITTPWPFNLHVTYHVTVSK